jgi:hypothetical protein
MILCIRIWLLGQLLRNHRKNLRNDLWLLWLQLWQRQPLLRVKEVSQKANGVAAEL